jgi:hypothetical protein
MNADDIKHGCTTAYQYHKCRCELCKKAQRDYMRSYRSDATNKETTARNNSISVLRKQYAWQWVKQNRPDVAGVIREKANKKAIKQ